jgi:TIR domain-containing protein
LFLISPDSCKSKVCKQEIEHAIKNGKRLIPLVVQEVTGDETPSELGHLNWIFIRESDDFELAFQKLITSIQTDYVWAQAHRELQVKALDWEKSGRENSFLLFGKSR